MRNAFSTHSPLRFGYGCFLAGAVTALVLVAVAPQPALAQMCERPLCSSDETYARSGVRDGRPYGVCQGEPNWLGHRSHRLVECSAGWTLDTSRGMCSDDGCSRGCGQTRPVCPFDSVFQRQEEGRDGPYAVCGSRSGIGDYASHTPVTCREGWRLIAGGLCRKECAVAAAGPIVSPSGPGVLLRADLVISKGHLRTHVSGPPVRSVANGRPYFVCFTVANRGNLDSGPFRVSGGGLGVSGAPYRDQPTLGNGDSRDVCLKYPTTPRPGTYTLGLTVDSRNSVRETREDNNTSNLTVTVTP